MSSPPSTGSTRESSGVPTTGFTSLSTAPARTNPTRAQRRVEETEDRMPDTEAAPAERPGRYRGMRTLRVLRTAAITPRMRRITLGGEEIAGIAQGPNIKLLIPPPGLAEPELPTAGPNGRAIWPAADKRPAVRTYSVRRFDAAAGELDVDSFCTAMRAPPRGGPRAHSRETFLESEDPEEERSAMPTGTCWRATTRRCRRSARSSKSFLPRPVATP